MVCHFGLCAKGSVTCELWVEYEGVVAKKESVTYFLSIRKSGRVVLVSWGTAVKVSQIGGTQAIDRVEAL